MELQQSQTPELPPPSGWSAWRERIGRQRIVLIVAAILIAGIGGVSYIQSVRNNTQSGSDQEEYGRRLNEAGEGKSIKLGTSDDPLVLEMEMEQIDLDSFDASFEEELQKLEEDISQLK